MMYYNGLLNTEKNNTLTDFSFTEGISYINTQQWHFAYLVFTKLYQNTKVKSVALLYNTALCYFMASENSKAFNLLSEAITQLSTPSIKSNLPVIIPAILFENEYSTNQHHLALLESALQQNTNLIKLRIRRLLVDVHLVMENWEEIIKLSELPEMNKCNNVLSAVAIAKSKTNNQL